MYLLQNLKVQKQRREQFSSPLTSSLNNDSPLNPAMSKSSTTNNVLTTHTRDMEPITVLLYVMLPLDDYFGVTLKIHKNFIFDQNQLKISTQHKNMYMYQKKI